MEIRITNAEVMNLHNALSNLNITGSAKFAYAIARTKSFLKPIVESLQEAAQQYAKAHPQLRDYQEKMDKVLVKHAVDKDGKPVTRLSADGSQLNRIIPPEQQAAYVEARRLLDEEYKDVLLGAQLHAEDFARVLKEETTVRVHGIKLADIPDGQINTQIMNLIFVMVMDEPGTVTPIKPVEKAPGDAA